MLDLQNKARSADPVPVQTVDHRCTPSIFDSTLLPHSDSSLLPPARPHFPDGAGSCTLSSDIQNRPTRSPATTPPTLAAGPQLFSGQEKRAATETPPSHAAPAPSVILGPQIRKPILVKTPFIKMGILTKVNRLLLKVTVEKIAR